MAVAQTTAWIHEFTARQLRENTANSHFSKLIRHLWNISDGLDLVFFFYSSESNDIFVNFCVWSIFTNNWFVFRYLRITIIPIDNRLFSVNILWWIMNILPFIFLSLPVYFPRNNYVFFFFKRRFPDNDRHTLRRAMTIARKKCMPFNILSKAELCTHINANAYMRVLVYLYSFYWT